MKPMIDHKDRERFDEDEPRETPKLDALMQEPERWADTPFRRGLTEEQAALYTERRDVLAQTLYEFVHGPGTWATVDDFKDEETDLRAFYTSDADEVLHLLPHLLPLPARTDLPFPG
jgi:hypothetical protein